MVGIEDELPEGFLLGLQTAVVSVCNAAVEIFDNLPEGTDLENHDPFELVRTLVFRNIQCQASAYNERRRSLPPELLDEIFRDLSFVERVRVSGTCQAWRRRAHTSLSPIVIPTWATDSQREVQVLTTMLEHFHHAPLIFESVVARSSCGETYSYIGRMLRACFDRVQFLSLDILSEGEDNNLTYEHLVPVFRLPAPSLHIFILIFEDGTAFAGLRDDWFGSHAPLLQQCSFSHPIKPSMTFVFVTTLEIIHPTEELTSFLLCFLSVQTLLLHQKNDSVSGARIPATVRDIWLADYTAFTALRFSTCTTLLNVYIKEPPWDLDIFGRMLRRISSPNGISSAEFFKNDLRLTDALGRSFVFRNGYLILGIFQTGPPRNITPTTLSVYEWRDFARDAREHVDATQVTHLTILCSSMDVPDNDPLVVRFPALTRLTIVALDSLRAVTIDAVRKVLEILYVDPQHAHTLRVEVRGAALTDSAGDRVSVIPGLRYSVDVSEAEVEPPTWMNDPHGVESALIYNPGTYLP